MKQNYLMFLIVMFFSAKALHAQTTGTSGDWNLRGNAATDTSVNFIGTTDNKGFKIRTNNIDRMYVGTNNRVGFGTNAPVNNLDVVNNSAVTLGIRSLTGGATMSMDRGSASANAAFAYRSFGTVLWNSGLLGNDNFTIRNVASGNNVLIITPTNNIGIGTGSPSVKLEINGNTKTTGFESVNDAVINSINIGRGGGNVFGNTSIGQTSLYYNTSGIENTALGYEALTSNTSGSANTALGMYALRSNTEGYSNVAVGRFALSSNTLGHYNVGIGFESLLGNYTGNENTGVGHQALHSCIGNDNTALGAYALFPNNGNENTAVGSNALSSNWSGSSNVAIGFQSLLTSTTGNGNIAIGKGADVLFADLDSTVAIGTNAKAGVKNAIVLGDSTNAVVGIGTSYPRARLHLKSNSTNAIGNLLIEENQFDYARITFTNSLYPNRSWNISALSDTSSNNEKLTFGTFTGGTMVTLNGKGNMGIGIASPTEKLHVSGNQIITGRLGLPIVNSVTKLNIEDTHASDAFIRMINTTKGPNISWAGIGTSGDWALRSCSNSGVVGLQDQVGGRIGLGTTNPSTGAKTELYGQSGISTAVFTSPLAGQVQSWVHYGSTGDWYIRSALVSGSVILQDLGGSVCIGTTTPAAGYKLSVNGKLIAEELKVQLKASWPDYVFDDNYELQPLSAVSDFIKQNKHLPGIPSSNEIEEQKGFEVGDMQVKLLQKIEELTLHVIELEKEIEALKKK